MSAKKLDEMMPLKPCETISKSKPADTTPINPQGNMMVIKPCKTTSTRKSAHTMPSNHQQGDIMFINSFETILSRKPLDTISERSVKKRRVMSSAVEEDVVVDDVEGEEEEEEEDEEDDDEEMQLDLMDPFRKFKLGKHFDLKALLSTETRNFLVTPKGGEIVPIASLEGNYVLVCCFPIPFKIKSYEASVCRNLEALFSRLSLNGIAHNVKLVAVAKIALGFGKADFDSFFSHFSVDCLAIPFSDSTSRDKVIESFGFCHNFTSWESPCLVVDPNGTVLQFDPLFLYMYGAESFPFTEEHLNNIQRQDEILQQRLCSTDSPISLSELLQCDYLSRIAEEDSRIPISDLGDTVVALYLYVYGNFTVKLEDIHKKCLEEGRKFEIVLIPIPFECYHDPASFFSLMKQSALKNSLTSSWLVFPFNEEICRILWRLYHCLTTDQLIILPNGDRPGDIWGKHIATTYGIDAYPFTRNIIIDRKVNEIRSMTLEQLVGDIDNLGLRNKNVLLYLDHPTFGKRIEYPYDILDLDDSEFKAKYPCSEVFFVPLSPPMRYICRSKVSQMCVMKWPILPAGMRDSVIKHIYGKRGVYGTLVTFGKDGKIRSLSAQDNQPRPDSSVSLFDDTLASEILYNLEVETRE